MFYLNGQSDHMYIISKTFTVCIYIIKDFQIALEHDFLGRGSFVTTGLWGFRY